MCHLPLHVLFHVCVHARLRIAPYPPGLLALLLFKHPTDGLDPLLTRVYEPLQLLRDRQPALLVLCQAEGSGARRERANAGEWRAV